MRNIKKKVFGVQTKLTEEDLEALERAKRKRGYEEPEV
jgi:predicted DNA-binding WGR domain protein